MKNSTYENSVFITEMDANGIVRTTVKEGAEVEVEHALENTEFVRKLCQQQQVPILVDMRKIKSISREARSHFSMKGRKGYASCIGLLIKSPVSRVIGNFYLGISKPTVATRLFTTEKEATVWLMKYRG